MKRTARFFAAAVVAALALAACSQENAPSDAIKDAADTVVDKVEGSEPVKLAPGKYAPRDECADVPGAQAFRAELAAAVTARDADRLVALAAPDVTLDFGGGAGAATLRQRLAAAQPDLWAELEELTALGCAKNEQGGITLPWYFAHTPGDIDPASAMIVTGEAVPLLERAADGAAERARISWDLVDLENGLQPGAPYQAVVTSDGTAGFIETARLRSVLDYRLVASSRDGKWSFTSFVAGD